MVSLTVLLFNTVRGTVTASYNTHVQHSYIVRTVKVIESLMYNIVILSLKYKNYCLNFG